LIDANDLRVLIIDTEAGYGIDQNSSVEEMLACPGVTIYKLGDYFKAQNDEAVPLLHWSFLINVKTNEELTGVDTL
jgi:hypothetical protein